MREGERRRSGRVAEPILSKLRGHALPQYVLDERKKKASADEAGPGLAKESPPPAGLAKGSSSLILRIRTTTRARSLRQPAITNAVWPPKLAECQA